MSYFFGHKPQIFCNRLRITIIPPLCQLTLWGIGYPAWSSGTCFFLSFKQKCPAKGTNLRVIHTHEPLIVNQPIGHDYLIGVVSDDASALLLCLMAMAVMAQALEQVAVEGLSP
jgi:hypothetical protein